MAAIAALGAVNLPAFADRQRDLLGAGHLFLYNDTWAALLGERHPWALGRPAAEVLADIWPVLEEQFSAVYERAETVNRVGHAAGPKPRRRHVRQLLVLFASAGGERGRHIGGLLGQARETTGACSGRGATR